MSIKITERVTKAGKKRTVTSSYFDDVRMIRNQKMDQKQSLYDLRHECAKDHTRMQFNTEELALAQAVMEITLWKKGCWELNDWVNKHSNKELLDGCYTTKFMGESWEDLVAKDEREEAFKRGELIPAVDDDDE
jgi:hypothetical protein